MPNRLPDELFRKSGVDESPDRQKGATSVRAARRSSRAAQRSRDVREYAPPIVVAGVVSALIIGFGIGKLVLLQPQGAELPEPPVTSVSSTPTIQPSPESTVAPWSGSVRRIPALEATGRCLGAMGETADPPANLLDDDPTSRWRCTGPGVGETISFDLVEGEELVGVRLINGNTSDYDRYLAERRILSVKWEFSDGSWVVQPLKANDRELQEVRFPPTTTNGPVTMTVLDATVPGESSEQDVDDTVGRNDAVSISALQFLGVA